MKWPLFLFFLNTFRILIAINLTWQDYLDLANLYTSRNIVDLKRSLTTHEGVFKTVSLLSLLVSFLRIIVYLGVGSMAETFSSLHVLNLLDCLELVSMAG